MIDYPFHHVIIDGMLTDEQGRAARSEFDAVNEWRWFDSSRERKAQAPFECGGETIQGVADMLRSVAFIDRVGEMFGIDRLSFDEYGGGLHRIKPGGLLDIHVDFNRHDDGRYRRINALLYLNDNPHPSADLLLAPCWPCEQVVRVRPTMGRLVLFETSEHSWHGHPEPLQGNQERRSLAAYYYTTKPPDGVAESHSTIFATPGPPW